MVSTRTIGSGSSPDKTKKSLIVPSADDLFWGILDGFVADRSAVMIDAGSGHYQNAKSNSDPAIFRLQDLVADRVYTPDRTANRHPYIVTDNLDGQPCYMFGMGGSAPNDLDAASGGKTGVMVALSDIWGVDVSTAALFANMLGFSVVMLARLPPVAGTINGVTLASGIGGGGAVFAGGGTTTTDQNLSPTIGFGSGNGHTRLLTQSAITTSGQYFDGGVDHRNNHWTAHVMTWDPAAQTAKGWYRVADDTTHVYAAEVASTPLAGITSDVGTANGAAVPMIGGVGAYPVSGGPSNRFVGALRFAALMATPVLNDATKRAGAFGASIAPRA